jgi:hypothetical protein
MTGTARARHVARGEGDRLTINGTERHMKLTGPIPLVS